MTKKMLNFNIALLLLTVFPQLALGAGKLQNEDFKTLSQLTGAGGSAAQLLNDTKIYVTANGINSQLSAAITNGAIGGGGGAGGVELLRDTGFEAAVSPEFTNTGGTFTHVTSGANLLVGIGSATFQASATAQHLRSAAKTVPNGLFGRACSAQVLYKGGHANLKFQVVDGSSNVLASQIISPSTAPATLTLTFICPSAGTIQWDIASTGASSVVAVDMAHLGENVTAQVSQAELMGTATSAATASCSWQVSGNDVITPFPVDTDCPVATVTGKASAPATKIPAITFASLPPGEYEISASGYFANSTAGVPCAWYVSDGTSSKYAGTNYENAAAASPSLAANFSYSTAQSNVTFVMAATGSSANAQCDIVNTTPSSDKFIMRVKRFPSSSETAVTAANSSMSWSGYQTVTSGWDTTSATYVDPNVGVGVTLVELKNRNFGTVISEASGLPGITWQPSRTGRYWVCAGVNELTSASTDIGAQLTDGSNNLIDAGDYHRNIGNTNTSTKVCGIQDIVSLASPATTKVRLSVTGGATAAITSTNVPAPSAAIRWSIFNMDTPFPNLVIPGSVVSLSAGVLNTVAFAFAGNSGGTAACGSDPCVIVRQTGGIASVNWASGANYTINFTAGAFSAPPTCNFTSMDIAAGVIATESVRPTTLAVGMTTFNAAGAQVDEGVNGICIGPK